MIAVFKPCRHSGAIDAPPSKSMAHRYLIGASLCGEKCTVSGVDFNEDILATIDCLRALGAQITINGSDVTVDPLGFMKGTDVILKCRESGSTLRFFIPLALCLGTKVTLCGSERLFERPLCVYEELCREKSFMFQKKKDSLTLCGRLEAGEYTMNGSVSSQFISGMIFALVYLGKSASLEILPPFESKAYVDLTISALQSFGAGIHRQGEYKIIIEPSKLHAFSGKVEGDYSNGAFLDAFNYIGSRVQVGNLRPDSLQGDRAYIDLFRQISEGTPTIDISDCPDLGPVLFALASLKNGAVFTGTKRLKAKESDRGEAMHRQLSLLGGGLIIEDDKIIVPKQELKYSGKMLDSHNDHRIVMAMSVILSKIGGAIGGAEAVRKSYPAFFEDIKSLGAQVELS